MDDLPVGAYTIEGNDRSFASELREFELAGGRPEELDLALTPRE